MGSIYCNPVRKETSTVQDSILKPGSLPREQRLWFQFFGLRQTRSGACRDSQCLQKQISLIWGKDPRPCPLPSPCSYMTSTEGFQYNKLLSRLKKED